MLAERTFRATFASENSAEDLDLHCRQSYSEALQEKEIADSALVTWVYEDAGTLIGFAQLRWASAAECVKARTPGEIQRLYVVKERHGTGVARELMDACLGELKARGADVAWLGVWERNPRAIAFYKKFGFAEAGDHVFMVGKDPQRDIVMARPV